MNNKEAIVFSIISTLLIGFAIYVIIDELNDPKEFKNWGEGDCQRYTGSIILQCMQMKEIIKNQETIIELLTGIDEYNLENNNE